MWGGGAAPDTLSVQRRCQQGLGGTTWRGGAQLAAARAYRKGGFKVWVGANAEKIVTRLVPDRCPVPARMAGVVIALGLHSHGRKGGGALLLRQEGQEHE